MNPARLAELQHQRSLVRQQLEWLEREITRESAAEKPVANVPVPFAPITTFAVKDVADFESYAPDPISTAAQTKRGCFIALAVVVLLILATFTAIYLLKYRNRPLLFASPEVPVQSAPAKAN